LPHPRDLNFYIFYIHRGKCLKYLLLKNHYSNFNQTWQETCLEDGDLDWFKKRASPFWGPIRGKIRKILINVLLMNHVLAGIH